MNTIKNIIFDFGGVLLDLYIDKTYIQLSDLLGRDMELNALPPDIINTLNAFEKGTMRFETFLWNLQRLSTRKTPQPRAVINAWNAMLGGWQTSKLDLLENLKDKYSLYLLSNTNETHLDWVYKDLKSNHQIEDFDTRFFKKTYYSHLVGMRKPDSDIFEFVVNDAKINPSDTLFIDDNEDNINTAKKLGINTICHDCNAPLDFLLDL